MRQGQNNRRSRGRSNNRRSNVPNRNQTFDSNGPDTRIRGNASQVLEKYQALARDAMSSGDPVMVENYLQHAEHYQRVINQMNEAVAQAQLQAEQAREQRAAVNPQQNGRAQPIPENSSERPDRQERPERQERQEPRQEGNGTAFAGSGADPSEQPAADFGRDPREETQPDVRQEAAKADAPAEAATPPVETAAEEVQEEKPRRRRGRPRRVKTEEEPAVAPAPASAD